MPKKMFLFFFFFFLRLNKKDGENVFRGESFGHNHYCDYCCGYPCVKMISLYCKYYLYLFLYIFVCVDVSLFTIWWYPFFFFFLLIHRVRTQYRTTITTTPSSSCGRKRFRCYLSPPQGTLYPHQNTQHHTHTHHPRFCLSKTIQI